MTVKVFTGSGQFTVKDEKPTANRASYIQASGGNETIVSTYDKLSHPYCGTPKCCGMCKTANVTEQMDREFSEHCETFFKGKNKD